MRTVAFFLWLGFLSIAFYCYSMKDIYTEVFFAVLSLGALIVATALKIVEDINKK